MGRGRRQLAYRHCHLPRCTPRGTRTRRYARHQCIQQLTGCDQGAWNAYVCLVAPTNVTIVKAPMKTGLIVLLSTPRAAQHCVHRCEPLLSFCAVRSANTETARARDATCSKQREGARRAMRSMPLSRSALCRSQPTLDSGSPQSLRRARHSTACINAVQHVATQCNFSQRTATCCNAMCRRPRWTRSASSVRRCRPGHAPPASTSESTA